MCGSTELQVTVSRVAPWGQVAKLTAGDAAAFDEFEFSVSISADTVVVGAYADDDGGTDSGSIYLFNRDRGGVDNWGQFARITASDATFDDVFGWSVSISGDTAVVGAFADDDGEVDSGSAYVYDPLPTPIRNLGSWGTRQTRCDFGFRASTLFLHPP